jgi:hypothetical protein
MMFRYLDEHSVSILFIYVVVKFDFHTVMYVISETSNSLSYESVSLSLIVSHSYKVT